MLSSGEIIRGISQSNARLANLHSCNHAARLNMYNPKVFYKRTKQIPIRPFVAQQ